MSSRVIAEKSLQAARQQRRKPLHGGIIQDLLFFGLSTMLTNDQNPSKNAIMQTLTPLLFIGAMIIGYFSYGLMYDRVSKSAYNAEHDYHNAYIGHHSGRAYISSKIQLYNRI